MQGERYHREGKETRVQQNPLIAFITYLTSCDMIFIPMLNYIWPFQLKVFHCSKPLYFQYSIFSFNYLQLLHV